MNNFELSARTSFVDMVKNILGNHRAENYKEFVEQPLKSLQEISANMCIKIWFLLSHLDKFRDNCGDVSDEEGYRFHQDIQTIKERYQGRWDKQW